jgi:hypothetical protein
MVILTIPNNSEINDPTLLSKEMLLNCDENVDRVKGMAAY